MRFARMVFRVAGVYGLIVLVPQLFMEELIVQRNPPPLGHPEYFYGFLGVTIAWQVAFLAIAHDPLRLRMMMIPAMLEKFRSLWRVSRSSWRTGLPRAFWELA